MISEPMVYSAQTMHLSGIKIVTISNRNEIRFYMTHITKQFHHVRPKRFLRLWYVRCKQSTYLAPTLTLSPNGRNEIPHHPHHLGFHRVHVKRFLSLWYVRRKPCTFLASRLVLSPNGPIWASTWASSSRNSIGSIQNDFLAYGTFGATGAPILHLH
jgi:hypothetical protein